MEKDDSSSSFVDQLEEELKRDTYKKRYWKMLRSTISILIVVTAIAVLISNLFLPILRIYGSSMMPTLVNGNIVAAIRSVSYTHLDVYKRQPMQRDFMKRPDFGKYPMHLTLTAYHILRCC